MISDEEIRIRLTTAIELMEVKEYRGAKQIINKIATKLQKRIDEDKRQARKKEVKTE